MSNEELFEKLRTMGAETDGALENMGAEDYAMFLRQFPQNEDILALRKAVDAGDCKAASEAVHSLKGVALYLGLLPLVDVCMDMLMDFRADEGQKALAQIDAVESCFHEWATAVEG